VKGKSFLMHSLATSWVRSAHVFAQNSQIDKVSNTSLHVESFLRSMSSSWRSPRTIYIVIVTIFSQDSNLCQVFLGSTLKIIFEGL